MINYCPKVKNSFVVLDTSALVHDPSCIDHYKGHIVVVTGTVLQELDKLKETLIGGKARNVRLAMKSLERYAEAPGEITKGIKLKETGITVMFTPEGDERLPAALSSKVPDDRILGVCLALKKAHPKKEVLLVSNDRNLGLKAKMYGVSHAKYQDKLVEISSYTGYRDDPIFEDKSLKVSKVVKAYNNGVVYKNKQKFQENEFFLLEAGSAPVRCFFREGVVYPVGKGKQRASGIEEMNLEQGYALSLLLDPNIKLVTLTGRAGSGKAQPLTSSVLTPKGFVLMGDIKKGSKVLTPKGLPTKVLEVFPQGKKQVYELEFSDGRKVESCGEHLWPILGANFVASRVTNMTTTELIEWKKNPRNKTRGRIPLVSLQSNLKQEDTKLPVDPYLLGCLIGDGCIRHTTVLFSTGDRSIVTRLQETLGSEFLIKKIPNSDYDYRIKDLTVKHNGKGRTANRLMSSLKLLGLQGKYSYEKTIPRQYLEEASIRQKWELIQGLFDTDGTVNKSNSIKFSSTSKHLAEQVQSLVWELGGIAKITSRITSFTDKFGAKQKGRRSYRVNVRHVCKRNFFKLERKLDRITEYDQYSENLGLGIKAIRKLKTKVECQCILVEDSEHLYVTDNYVVTHNTLLTMAAAISQVMDTEGEPEYEKIIMSRSLTVLGGKDRLGFLPGDLKAKLQPFIMPLKDAIDQIMGPKNDIYEVVRRR